MKIIRTWKDDLIQCIELLILGLGIWAPFIPDGPKKVLGPILLAALLCLAVVSMVLKQKRRNMSPAEQRDLERESRDERAQMIQDRAAQYCRWAEDLTLTVVLCVLVFQDYPYAYVVYWILVGRDCLSLAIRWWLGRKY